MTNTTIKKVSATHSPHGEMGQKYLASGTQVAMRLWQNEQPSEPKPEVGRDYETVGYVISGRAELLIAEQKVILEAGDSWLVPAQTEHTYNILEPFTAIEATSPPAQIENRDRDPR